MYCKALESFQAGVSQGEEKLRRSEAQFCAHHVSATC